MKKGLCLIVGLFLLAFLGCKQNASLDVTTGGSGNGSSQGQETLVEIPAALCTITGKAFYSNSTDSSSIQMYIDKTEGVFSTPALNMFYNKTSDLTDSDSSRTIVSYKNCAKDGSYSFSDLQPGVYTIYAVSPDSQEKAVCKSITVTAGETLEIPDLTLTATGSLSGRITLDNSQNNNAGFVVFAAGTSFMAVTGSSGNFTISGVPANTSYEIVVMKGSFTYLWKTNIQAAPLADTQIGEKDFSSIELLDNFGLKYPITYELNGGELPEGYPVTHTYGTTTTLLEPVREGYIFYGYHLREDCLDEPFTEIGNNYGVGQTLYVKWIVFEQPLELISFTESGTFALSGNISDTYLDDLIYVIKLLDNINPEIKITLDFSGVTGLIIQYEQNFNDCSNISGVVLSPVLLVKWETPNPSYYTYPNYSNYSKLFGDNDNLKTAVLYEGIQSIPDYAFVNCSTLQSIEIPPSVTAIGDYAFESSGLTSITLSDTVSAIGIGAFEGCADLTNVSLPETITSIGNYVFSGCSSLPSISLPENVRSIGDGAFSGCSSLPSISLPENIRSIGDGAFSDCSQFTNIVIPNAVTSIGSYTFCGCTKLQSISMPSGATVIGDYAFYKCDALESINIGNKVETIGINAFCWCSSLVNITIGSGVKKISDYAFRGCNSLESITIPSNVNYIGSCAFYECENLTSISMTGTLFFWEWGTDGYGVQVIYEEQGPYYAVDISHYESYEICYIFNEYKWFIMKRG